MFLRLTQQRLVNQQYHNMPSGSGSFMPSSDELTHVTCLQISLQSKRDCRNARMLLERTVCVTSLSIQLSTSTLDYGPGKELEAGRGSVGTLFASNDAVHRGPKLQRLRICSMSFSAAGAILPTVLACDGLQHLHLLCCSDTDKLCESLAPFKLKLRSFFDTSHDADRKAAHAIFLQSLSCLRTLRLAGNSCALTPGFEGYLWPMIVAHSLRSLDISELHVPKLDEANKSKFHHAFKALCTSASNLQQLSIADPEIKKNNWSPDNNLLPILVNWFCCTVSPEIDADLLHRSVFATSAL